MLEVSSRLVAGGVGLFSLGLALAAVGAMSVAAPGLDGLGSGSKTRCRSNEGRVACTKG